MSKIISDLSVVRLMDGREGTIMITHYADKDEREPVAYLIELADTSDLVTVRPYEIIDVLWP